MTYTLLAILTAFMGAVGGIGGAVLLVPALVVGGMSPAEAAPLGLISVVAGSVAAGPEQLLGRFVNHRLGVSVEVMAASGAALGALGSAYVSDTFLRWVLVGAATAAALAGLRTTGIRNPPSDDCTVEDIGERVGSLDGAYPLGKLFVPYRPKRFKLGLASMSLAGLIAGLSGTSGGFIKTPILTEIMYVPHKVAGPTTVFTGGLTAATALCVFAIQGRINPGIAAPIVVGALIGGQLGGRVGNTLSPPVVRYLRAGILFTVSAILVASR